MIITLRAKNPQMSNDMVRFSHVEGRFVPVKLKERMIDHLNIVSTIVHKSSDEARLQIGTTEAPKGIKQ